MFSKQTPTEQYNHRRHYQQLHPALGLKGPDPSQGLNLRRGPESNCA